MGTKRMSSISRTRGKQAEAQTERGRKAKLAMFCLHDASMSTLQEYPYLTPHTGPNTCSLWYMKYEKYPLGKLL